MSVTFDDIRAARARIADGIYATPCPESVPLSEICGCRVWCKLDYLQRTGSFKERGARNALLLLGDGERRRGVIAASAGNHALGLAYHGRLLGVPATVVMPRFAPLVKSETARRLGARVVLEGETLGDARAHAEALAARDGLAYLHGFDDPAIIAGQGTMGLEILEQVPDLDAIIVPVGGAGLLAGVALAAKTLKPSIRVIGVEPRRAAGFAAARAAGRPVPVPLSPTLADGLAVPTVGSRAFAIAEPLVDRVVGVGEDDLALAILRLLELEKGVVEGAGAAPLAALLAGRLPDLAGRRVVLALTGGNIDPMLLARVIGKGLVADGRLCRFTAAIPDRPGGLAELATLVGSAGASIQEVVHERAFCGPDFFAVQVLCTVETRDRGHAEGLRRLLAGRGVRLFAPEPAEAGG